LTKLCSCVTIVQNVHLSKKILLTVIRIRGLHVSKGNKMLDSTEQIIQVLGLIAIAVVAAFVGIQQLMKNWKSTQAESGVIQIMHRELERMGDQNTKLSIELGRLHDQIIQLNGELQKLTIENQRLQIEVVALKDEVSMFKKLAQETKGRRYATAS